MLRRLTTVAIAIATLIPAAVSAAETRSVTVPVNAADFDSRVARAAREVCGPRQISRLLDVQVLECRANAVADAQRQRENALYARTRLARAGASASGGQN